MIVYILSTFSKCYRKDVKMCDNIVKKNVCFKILLQAKARKAALVRNYFFRLNNLSLKGSSLSLLLSDF